MGKKKVSLVGLGEGAGGHEIKVYVAIRNRVGSVMLEAVGQERDENPQKITKYGGVADNGEKTRNIGVANGLEFATGNLCKSVKEEVSRP